MPTHISSSLSAPRIFTERSALHAKKSGGQELAAVALFSGIGLFVSLLAMIFGMQGTWF